MLSSLLIWTDLIIAILLIAGFVGAYLRKKLSLFHLQLFGLGILLGALWEWPLYWIGPEFSTSPPYRLLHPFPLHPITQPVSHMIWDGGLFMGGIFFVESVLPRPHFQSFSWVELGVYVIWGIGSALLFEILGAMGIWEYIPSNWNPELFQINGKSITALAPATWLIAPIFHYILAIILKKRS
ncbi:MAG: hypothetical protein AAF705_18050 [Bacteroidota bacterium]